MSSLWTPGGERPVPPAGSPEPDELTEEEVHAQMAELRDQLAKTPASTVVANHAYGLFELAALHLSLQPPQLGEAQLAIDALAALVDGVGSRLADHEGHLREGIAQLRLAFVQIRAANLGAPGAPGAPEAGAPEAGAPEGDGAG